MSDLSKKDAIKILKISENTFNRYIKEFHDYLNIDLNNIEDRYSINHVQKLFFIKEYLERPTYKSLRKMIYDDKIYNKKIEELSRHNGNKSLSLFASVSSILGLGIGIYSLVKTETQNFHKEIEILSNQFNDFINTFNLEFDEIKNIIGNNIPVSFPLSRGGILLHDTNSLNSPPDFNHSTEILSNRHIDKKGNHIGYFLTNRKGTCVFAKSKDVDNINELAKTKLTNVILLNEIGIFGKFYMKSNNDLFLKIQLLGIQNEKLILTYELLL